MINIIDWCHLTLNELQQYKGSNKDLLNLRVQERLQKSYLSYEEELDASLEYLKHRNELNVIKKLNRIQKKK